MRIGSNYKYNEGSTYTTSTFDIHPEYDPETNDYDVGIVSVLQGMNLDGSTARPANMVSSGQDPEPRTILAITAYGDTGVSTVRQTLFSLQTAHVTYLDIEALRGNTKSIYIYKTK